MIRRRIEKYSSHAAVEQKFIHKNAVNELRLANFTLCINAPSFSKFSTVYVVFVHISTICTAQYLQLRM